MAARPHGQRDAWAGNPADPVNVLPRAATIPKGNFGRLDVPLREVLRLRRGKVDSGLGGGLDCLRAIYAEVSEDGRMAGNDGDCCYQYGGMGQERQTSF